MASASCTRRGGLLAPWVGLVWMVVDPSDPSKHKASLPGLLVALKAAQWRVKQPIGA